jgi:hypothetical protein
MPVVVVGPVAQGLGSLAGVLVGGRVGLNAACVSGSSNAESTVNGAVSVRLDLGVDRKCAAPPRRESRQPPGARAGNGICFHSFRRP